MLSQRLSLILYSARTLSLNPVKSTTQVVPSKDTTQITNKNKFGNLHTEGPELEVTKILMKNGALTSREIWRSYQLEIEERRKAKEEFNPYFNSLSHLKKTLGFMRTNGKIRGSGYDKRKRMFLGWKLEEKRALKFVHPDVLADLEAFLKSKNEL